MKSRESVIRLKRFHVEEKRRQVAQIETMIAEFERMAKDLDDQIHAEQERSGIRDANHFAYPTFAKAATQRRDNLSASADELKESSPPPRPPSRRRRRTCRSRRRSPSATRPATRACR